MNKHVQRLLPVVNKLIAASVSQNEKRLEIAAVQQFIENCIDAKASEIHVLVDYGQHFRIIDNGRGLTERDLRRLNSFMQEEDAKDPLENIGKNNSGRIAGLGCCRKLEFYSATEGGKILLRTDLTREKIAHIVGDPDTYKNPPEHLSQLPRWLQSHLSSGHTGTAVNLCEADWAGFRTVNKKSNEKLKTALSEILGPWVARMVRINGEAIPPLYTDNPFEGEEQDKDLGRIRWALYHLPRQKRRAKDVIRIGGPNPLLKLGVFLRNAERSLALAQPIPDWMYDNEVAGFLDFAVVNKFAAHDRNNVEEELFKDHPALLAKILDKIAVIGRAAETKYGLSNQRNEDPTENLRDIAEEMFDRVVVKVKPPTPDPPKAEVMLTPTNREVTPGDLVEIRVKKGGKNGRWDIPDGICNEKGVSFDEDGLGISFTASERLGEHTVTYHAKKSGSAHSFVDIVAERKMRIRPGLVMVPPYTHEVILENCDEDPESIKWTFEQLALQAAQYLSLTPSKEDKTAVVTVDARCPTGVYTLAARSKHGKVTSNIWVKEKASTIDTVTDPDLYWIAGYALQLQEGSEGDPPVTVKLRQRFHDSSPGETAKEVQGIIIVNPAAPQFNQSKELQKQLIAHRMILAVVAEVARNSLVDPEAKDSITNLVRGYDNNTVPHKAGGKSDA